MAYNRTSFHPYNALTPVTLYRVYDCDSQSPLDNDGFACGDPNTYVMNAWHVITPAAICRHLKWRNRRPTQFISFYNNLADALREFRRRRNNVSPHYAAATVRIAVIQIIASDNIWAFPKQQLMAMMNSIGGNVSDINASMGGNEWMVWEFVPRRCVRQVTADGVNWNDA